MERQTLFARGDGGYSAFRIPTILTLSSGRVLVFCEGRRDGLGDSGRIDIMMRAGDGDRFGDMRVVVSGGGDTVGNPCPVQDRSTGRVFLVYNRNDADKPEMEIMRGRGPRTVHVIYSDDEGETWSSPRDMTADVKPSGWTWYAVGPCHGVCLPSGRLMLGANHAVLDEAAGCSGPYMSHTIYSDDHGETWRLGESVGVCTNECSLAAFSDGEVLINMRHMPYGGAENPHCRAQAWAADGAHFSQAALMPALVDATCQGSLLTVTTPRGEEVLLSNARSTARENLTVQRSLDRGRTWTVERVIAGGPSAYSDMTRLPDDRIALIGETGDETPYERLTLYTFTLK